MSVAEFIETEGLSLLMKRFWAFHGWLAKAHAVISFEEMTSGIQPAADAMCADLGINPAPLRAVLNENAPMVTPDYPGTFSGSLSDWKKYWTEPLDDLWNANGGKEVEFAYGYKN